MSVLSINLYAAVVVVAAAAAEQIIILTSWGRNTLVTAE